MRVIILTGAGRGFCAGADMTELGDIIAAGELRADAFEPFDAQARADSAAVISSFSRRGLIAEHGTSWMLTRLAGHSRAMDVLLSSRKAEAGELADLVSPRSLAVIKTTALGQPLSGPGRGHGPGRPRDGAQAPSYQRSGFGKSPLGQRW